ncbi:BT_3928 family protein [Oceanihabitans sediminis]|uniref:BT_3928 family protein n=1 Tax=Oceanihabitans sediminis TaxID=1812012 RepID=UPI00299D3252|nr:BT_3928 family protein [Oceanihabitans sediminis]MDX1774352.1 DoxX family protein [Oceanihabitans sediminis]
MKYIIHLFRILVGGLFIFSGLIKLNDPLGFSYKLQEYFGADVLNLPFLEPYALAISVFVVILEVVLGVFLLIGYKPKFTVWSLFAMIVFFTFLTFYAWYFDKVKDCGCFGDFMPMKPIESFIKDLILLFLIVILLIGLRYINPIFGKFPTTLIALFGFLGSLWFGYHVLMHLPTWDFRAYKVGANIQEGMSTPEDAAKPIQEYTWTFNVNGEEQEFVTNGSFPSVDGEYIGVETKVIDEGYDPPIKDFSIESDDEDLTEYYLEKENLIMVISYNLATAESSGMHAIKAATDKAIKNGYTVIGLSASGTSEKIKTNEAYNLNFNWYLCDEKALKTVVRANPGVVKLKKGTVIQKVHWNDIDDLELPEVEREKEVEKEVEETPLFLIDNEITTKEQADALDAEAIESIDVIKENTEGSTLDSINKVNNSSYTSLIKITLKKEE